MISGALRAPSAGATVNHEPFTWTEIEEFLPRADAEQLAYEFPEDGFRVAGSSAKLFHVRSLIVDNQLATSTTSLSSAWQALGRLLISPAYAEWVGALVGKDLTGLRVDASLCLYPPGCWLAPHTDRPMRVTTQIVYFNEEWRPEWGGMFRVLRSENMEDVAAEVLPVLHTSVVMLRADNSWHAVSPVADGVTKVRRSLLMHTSDPDAF
jgi:SM-20-related protein